MNEFERETLVELTQAPSKFRTSITALARGLPDVLTSSVALDPPSAQRQHQRRLIPAEIAQLVAEYQNGHDMQVLARTWGLHRTTVAAHLQRAGVVLRRQGLSPAQTTQAIALYIEGWSCQRLGERFGCSAETVRQDLMRQGVQLRSPWDRGGS